MNARRLYLTLILALGLGLVLVLGFFVHISQAAPAARPLLRPGDPVTAPAAGSRLIANGSQRAMVRSDSHDATLGHVGGDDSLDAFVANWGSHTPAANKVWQSNSTTTRAHAPPKISVSPGVLTSTQYMNQVVTKSLAISNGNGVTLTFNVEDTQRTAGLARAAPLHLPRTTEVFGGQSTPPESDQPSSAPVPPAEVPIVSVLADGVGPSAQIQAGWYYTTTVDNEDNAHTGNPDGDMDTCVFGGSSIEPIEFNILIDGAIGFTGNVLTIWAYDIDYPTEVDEVRLNGVYLGNLVGDHGAWSDSVFDLPAGALVSGPNLVEIDITSSRWCVNVDWARLFVAGAPVPWLDETPASGSLPSNSSQDITVTFDAAGLQPGEYMATVLVSSNDPVTPLVSVPVTMTVLPTANMGWVEGTVSDAATGDPLEATIVALGQPYTITADPDTGSYRLWLDAGNCTLQVAAAGYVTETAVVDIVAQRGTTQDLALVLNVPVLEVAPASIKVTHQFGDVTTRMLTITNDGPVNLTFDIITGSIEANTLERVLDSLNSNYQAVIDAIPNRYDFSEGEAGTGIRDGGGDMYDGGNYLSTNLGGYIEYSDNTIVNSTTFGGNGRYLTRKHPGLFVLVTDMEGVDYFEITGTLGADGGGSADGTILQTALHGVTYYGFVKRVYNARDPSVNHLIIVADNPYANHTFSTYTNDDFHQVYDLSQNTRLYYLLYAGTNGYYIDDSATLNIMRIFLDALGVSPSASWLSMSPVSSTVPAYSSTPVQVTFDATGMQPGTYAADIVVRSNDPVTPSVSVPVTMTVLPTADIGRVTGAVSDAWTGLPLTATVELFGVYSMTASPDYTIWAPAGAYSLAAYASGYVTTTRSVSITAGGLVTANLALEPAQARLEWAPATVSAVAVEGSKVTRKLTISNTRPFPLDVALYEISPTVALQALSPADLSGKRILYDRAHGEPSTSDYSSLIDDVISAGAVVTENFYTIEAAVLEGYDVLWVNCCGGTAWSFGELNALSDWLSEGGAVFVQGESSNATSRPASVFGINYQSGSCTSGTTNNISEHPISKEVSTVNVEWTCWRLAPGNGAEIVVYDSQGQPHVVAQEQNGGKMVVVASEDFTDSHIDNDDNRLLANNILGWLARPAYSDVPWLSETPQASTIPGHSSLLVTLEFDAATLSPGDYQATLAIEHNDPSQPSPVELPVTLTVVARQASLSLAPALQERPGFPGETVVYTLTVTNEGIYTDTFSLEASGVWTPTLSDNTSGPLGVEESTVFTLGVAIPSTAAYESSDTTTITARSALDPEVSESAQASTTVAREAALSLAPALQERSGFPGEMVVYTLTVTNEGIHTDTFSLEASGVWTTTLSDNSTGPLGVGESTVFTLGVAVPGAALYESSDATTITARSAFDPEVWESAQAGTTVARQAALSLAPPLQEGSGFPGETVVYTFTVTNKGNYTDTFSLEASGVWTTALSDNSTGPLGVGESTVFTLGVAVPSTAADESSDTTTVTAHSAFDPGVSESAEAVTTAASPLASEWKLFLPLILRNSG